MQGASTADVARVDLGAMEHLLRSFHETWRAGIEAINRDVMKSFANLKLGMDILKQVRVRVRFRVRVRGLGLELGLG